MLDSGASANIMTLKVMRQLGLEVTRPYGNVCGIESKAISTYGLIENLEVLLARYPEIVFLMDIVVVDIPDIWGMLLSRKFVAILGGTLQMDLSYATIPIGDETYAHIPNQPMTRDHVEEIDIDPENDDPLEEFLEEFMDSPPEFFPDDLPFTQEDDIDDIVWPKREDYQNN
jgi:hypothetical protein